MAALSAKPSLRHRSASRAQAKVRYRPKADIRGACQSPSPKDGDCQGLVKPRFLSLDQSRSFPPAQRSGMILGEPSHASIPEIVFFRAPVLQHVRAECSCSAVRRRQCRRSRHWTSDCRSSRGRPAGNWHKSLCCNGRWSLLDAQFYCGSGAVRVQRHKQLHTQLSEHAASATVCATSISAACTAGSYRVPASTPAKRPPNHGSGRITLGAEVYERSFEAEEIIV